MARDQMNLADAATTRRVDDTVPLPARGARPFTVDVPQTVLDDLSRRLDLTRWPPDHADTQPSDGAASPIVRELCRVWREEFDWRARERELNELPQYTVAVDGQSIHCVHVEGAGPTPLPLILTHGWPSTFVEMLPIVDALTDPAHHGGDERDAFSVVIPSLPGYAWSEPSRAADAGPVGIARLWRQLMAVLGYERFAAHGSDWGAAVTIALGATAPSNVVGMHVTHPAIPPVQEESLRSPEAHQWWSNVQPYRAEELGYVALQSTKPQTPAYALNDSPAGLVAWIVEKWWRWADIEDASGERDLSRAFTQDQLLTNVMVYWATESIGSSMRLYLDAARTESVLAFLPITDVPLGVAACREVSRPPRDLVEPHYDLRRWSELDHGGHFPAVENPDALVEEIRCFFRPLRGPASAP